MTCYFSIWEHFHPVAKWQSPGGKLISKPTVQGKHAVQGGLKKPGAEVALTDRREKLNDRKKDSMTNNWGQLSSMKSLPPRRQEGLYPARTSLGDSFSLRNTKSSYFLVPRTYQGWPEVSFQSQKWVFCHCQCLHCETLHIKNPGLYYPASLYSLPQFSMASFEPGSPRKLSCALKYHLWWGQRALVW